MSMKTKGGCGKLGNEAGMCMKTKALTQKPGISLKTQLVSVRLGLWAGDGEASLSRQASGVRDWAPNAVGQWRHRERQVPE
jgi:hypothetical protein